MTAASLRPPRPALALAGAVVLALHVLLVLLLSSLGAWRDRGPADPAAPPLTVWLMDDRPAAAAAPATKTPSTMRPQTPALPRLQRPVEPAAITLPALPAEPASPAAPASAAAAIAPAASAPAPLNLALPRGASAPWRQRNPALDDPRVTSARATFESRLAGALGGDGVWREERVDNDHVRFRRGNTCLDLVRSRAEQIDSFNQGSSPKPWLAGKPSAC